LVGCSTSDTSLEDAAPEAWPVHRFTREGPGEKIGEITLTDPTGGSPRPASIGTHGIRIVLDALASEVVVGVAQETDGGTGADGAAGTVEDVTQPTEVRVIYSRQGGAETRAFVAVEDPGQPGVYLGTVDLVAAGEWRIRVSIVDGGGGSAQITVPGR
jgi:hypothetical protein